MPNGFYRIDSDIVEPIFFAVVPDDFINRNRGGPVALRRYAHIGEWADESDTPILAPHDRWSF